MEVLPGVDVSKVKVTGPGVQGTTPASMPAHFTVDTREAGVADLECVVQVSQFPSDNNNTADNKETLVKREPPAQNESSGAARCTENK